MFLAISYNSPGRQVMEFIGSKAFRSDDSAEPVLA
jgi:hypothetical protein